MKRVKKQRLERAGWAVGDSAQFLQMSVEENRFIELKLALATGVRELRKRRGLTQAALAHRLGSSQSRVAKMEAADRSVSLDLIMRSLLTIGATATDIAKWIKRAETGMAPRHGFEPRFTAPKAAVLPLDDRGSKGGKRSPTLSLTSSKGRDL